MSEFQFVYPDVGENMAGEENHDEGENTEYDEDRL